MFNVDNIYDILNTNFLRPNTLSGAILHEFGKCDSMNDIWTLNTDLHEVLFNLQNVYFYDQEPVYDHGIVIRMHDIFSKEYNNSYYGIDGGLFATSEKNNPKVTAICTKLKLSQWYYFYHAFASLDWFRSIQYMPKVDNIWKGASFINLNNLYTGPRIYRLEFLSKLYKQGLFGEGIISYNINDYSSEIDHNRYLRDKDSVLEFCEKVGNSFRIQSNNYMKDNASAEQEYSIWTSAFWHVVSETCFYEKTLHLTEKVFKPIVARQPFLLLSTPRSLEYLREYGFKTFNKFIDESYDHVTDPELRMQKVVEQLTYICNLTANQKQEMYNDMQSILDYNFNHFYNELENIAWRELVTNFETALEESNNLSCLASYHNNIKQYQTFSEIPIEKRCVFTNKLYSDTSTLSYKLKKILK